MPKISEVSLEKAYDLVAELTQSETYEGQVTRVISGIHPKMGMIHITFPPMGNSTLIPGPADYFTNDLPIVTQDFELQDN